jgi:hypothetical protein
MERRLRMMIAGSIAVWVPVASAADARPAALDLDKIYRLKPERTSETPPDAR